MKGVNGYGIAHRDVSFKNVKKKTFYGVILMRCAPKKKELTLFYSILEPMTFHFGVELATSDNTANNEN